VTLILAFAALQIVASALPALILARAPEKVVESRLPVEVVVSSVPPDDVAAGTAQQDIEGCTTFDAIPPRKPLNQIALGVASKYVAVARTPGILDVVELVASLPSSKADIKEYLYSAT
jgi:hypothetical protein